MIIAAMVLGNIELSILSHISLKSLLNPHHNVANRLIFQNWEQDIEHVGIYIAGHRMPFSCIGGALERPIAGMQHCRVWLGL